MALKHDHNSATTPEVQSVSSQEPRTLLIICREAGHNRQRAQETFRLGQKRASEDPHCRDPELPREAPSTLTPHPTQTTAQEKPETGRETDRWTDGAGALAGHRSCRDLLSPAAWHTDGSEMPGPSRVGRQPRS